MLRGKNSDCVPGNEVYREAKGGRTVSERQTKGRLTSQQWGQSHTAEQFGHYWSMSGHVDSLVTGESRVIGPDLVLNIVGYMSVFFILTSLCFLLWILWEGDITLWFSHFKRRHVTDHLLHNYFYCQYLRVKICFPSPHDKYRVSRDLKEQFGNLETATVRGEVWFHSHIKLQLAAG